MCPLKYAVHISNCLPRSSLVTMFVHKASLELVPLLASYVSNLLHTSNVGIMSVKIQ
jgi:hypothetical protein